MDYMEKITELRAQKKGLKDQADTLVTEGKFEEASADVYKRQGKEHPPRSGKYYCRFHCEGTVVTQTAWWDGFLKSWVFKENGVKIDAICLGLSLIHI